MDTTGWPNKNVPVMLLGMGFNVRIRIHIYISGPYRPSRDIFPGQLQSIVDATKIRNALKII
jgi:hypothetical protein